MKQTTQREKILVYGSYKVGKSTLWLDIMQASYAAGLKIHFYLIDTDRAYSKMIEEMDVDYEAEGYLTVYLPDDFPELMEASMEIRELAGKGDWVVIDMLNYPWTETQDYYTEKVFGETPDNYFLAMREQVVAKKGNDARSFGGFEGTDWNFITKTYKQWETPLTMKGDWNVFAVTEARKMDSRDDDPEKAKTYKEVSGHIPVGQKGIGHRFDTVFHMRQRVNGDRELHMVGDRGREKEGGAWAELGTNVITIGEYPKGFTRRYLVDIAGWERGKKKKAKSAPKPRSKPGTSAPARRR